MYCGWFFGLVLISEMLLLFRWLVFYIGLYLGCMKLVLCFGCGVLLMLIRVDR